MKKLFCSFLIISISIASHAEDFIHGKVLSVNDSSALYMVKISLGNNTYYTNKNGEFNLPCHNDSVLLFEKAGYGPEKVILSCSRNSIIFLESLSVVSEGVIEEETEILYDAMLSGTVSGIQHKRSEANKTGYRVQNFSSGSGKMQPVSYQSESFSTFDVAGFKTVSQNPLSTFSTDVDVASYAIMRRNINNGMLPPQQSVRVEEMINYFDYTYDYPAGKDAISVNIDAGICPWRENHKLVRIGLQSKNLNVDKLPVSNFVFLIDVSGSMSSPDKLPLAKASLKTFMKQLRPDDKIAIVTYAGSTQTVLSSTSVQYSNQILQALEKLGAGGSTAGAEGLRLAYEEAERGYVEDGNNRIILVTDGDFNVGPSSVDELKTLIKNKRDKGINFSVLGFGTGNIKDDRMEAIAQNGNGNYSYVDNLQEAKKILMKEFSSNLFIAAKDVKIKVEFNPAVVEAYRLVGYENRALNDEDFNNDKIDASDMGINQQVTAIYEIALIGESGLPVIDPLKYKESQISNTKFADEVGTVKVRYKHTDNETSSVISKVIRKKQLSGSNKEPDFNFAVSVAMFGQILRGSDYVSSGDLSTVANMAVLSKGSDNEGYRAEFVRLVELSSLL